MGTIRFPCPAAYFQDLKACRLRRPARKNSTSDEVSRAAVLLHSNLSPAPKNQEGPPIRQRRTPGPPAKPPGPPGPLTDSASRTSLRLSRAPGNPSPVTASQAAPDPGRHSGYGHRGRIKLRSPGTPGRVSGTCPDGEWGAYQHQPQPPGRTLPKIHWWSAIRMTPVPDDHGACR